MSRLAEDNIPKVQSKSIEAELNLFEDKIATLRILYEQYFTGLLPLQPSAEHRETQQASRRLLNLPFRNAQSNFRLNQLQLRLQTLNTHWERVLKQKEDGTYVSDKFKAKIRKKRADREQVVKHSKKEATYDALFSSYSRAIKEHGLNLGDLDSQSFSEDLRKKAEILKAQKGCKEVRFRVEIENNKVTIKAKCS